MRLRGLLSLLVSLASSGSAGTEPLVDLMGMISPDLREGHVITSLVDEERPLTAEVLAGRNGRLVYQLADNGTPALSFEGNGTAADGEGVMVLFSGMGEEGATSLSLSMRIRIDQPKLATLARRTEGTDETGYMLYILDSGYVGFRLADETAGGTIRSTRSIGPNDGWVEVSVKWDAAIEDGHNAVLSVDGTIDRARIEVTRIPSVGGDLSIGGLQRSRDGSRPGGQYFAGAISGLLLDLLAEGELSSELRTRSDFIDMPTIFSDGMILQRDRPVPVWGWADPGSRVVVEIAGQRHTANAGPGGRWEVILDPVQTGDSHDLVVSSGVTRSMRDVLFGEVWLCSGQSNMEWTVRNTDEYDEELEIVQGASFPIRQFNFDRIVRSHPDRHGRSPRGWVEMDAAELSHFTAVGYHFARAIHEELNVPIGIINSTWGGSQIAPWIPMSALEADDRLSGYAEWVHGAHENNRLGKQFAVAEMREWLAQADMVVSRGGIPPNPPRWPSHPIHENRQTPTGMYNGMIAPVAGYGLRGFLYYQGESNRQDRDFYEVLMENLIAGWRGAWDDDFLPFYFVQVAPFRYGDNPGSLPYVQDAQRRLAERVPNTAMVVISDHADLDDIHPRRKREVGRRLALFALHEQYGRKNLHVNGPRALDCIVQGDEIRVRFDAPGGLHTRDGQSPDWFEVIDSEGDLHKPITRIDGSEVRLTMPEGAASPVTVRFAWSDVAIPNLVTPVGLPASPFSIDVGEAR